MLLHQSHVLIIMMLQNLELMYVAFYMVAEIMTVHANVLLVERLDVVKYVAIINQDNAKSLTNHPTFVMDAQRNLVV